MLHWTVETSESLICPALMILNIGQFLNQDMEKHGWDVQHWLEAYAYTLQWVGEAVVGRCWMSMGRDFAPRVSLLVEVFTDVLNVEIPPASAVNCWDSQLGCIPHQRDEGALAHIISYLDDKATHQPMCKVWDELVWPLPSSASPTLRWNEPHGFIQGHMVGLGPKMPPTRFHISSPMGEFICFAWGLIYEGTILAYDPITNGVEWISVWGTAQDLLRVQETSALTSWSHTSQTHSRKVRIDLRRILLRCGYY